MNCNENLKYVYFRNNHAERVGSIAIGYYVKGDNIRASVAFCSPNDFFSKKIARTIINGRFNSEKFVTIFHVSNNYIESILNHLINNIDDWKHITNIPSWYHKINFLKFIKPENCIVRSKKHFNIK